MRFSDSWQFSYQALRRYPVRTLLLVFAIAIGVTSVLLLTSIGEGAKRFIKQEFESLGTDMLIVLPGKKETTGGAPPAYGTSPRDLTIDDALALNRIPTIFAIAPVIAGTALVSYKNRSREVITIGSTTEFFTVRNLVLAQGKQLPENSAKRASQVAILGSKLKREFFGHGNALGEWIRFGDSRYRVIGILEERGESLGLDLRDMALIPVRSAESLFNSPGIFRLLIQLRELRFLEQTKKQVSALIKARHEGDDDITFISQNSIMKSFDTILTGVTVAVTCIGAISLVVAGFLIMNLSYVSVSGRRREIGLLKALGASKSNILRLFLMESILLVSAGYFVGLIIGYSLSTIASMSFSQFTFIIPLWAVVASAAVSLIIGILFSWLPSSHAASLDPVTALRAN